MRIPASAADRLDEAALQLRKSKQDLVAEALDQLTAAQRRVVVESVEDSLTVGHHSFVAAQAQQVMTVEEVAELLRVDEETVAEIAARGELPGRKLGDEWRFTRSAVLRWLGGEDEEA